MSPGAQSWIQGRARTELGRLALQRGIDGKPAAEPIPNPFGQETAGIPVGSVRDGGAFTERACVYSSWNSLMDEQQYQVERWNEFPAA